jgi:DNA-directed RNA polymerase specialized sigma24 family protein
MGGAAIPARSVGRPGWNADQAVTVLYGTDCRALTRLAALLVSDAAIAEEIVQDAFVAMHGAWRQLRDPDKALCFLRQAVLSRARSDRAAHPGPPSRPPGVSGDGHQAGTQPEPHLIAVLRDLPAWQREALVLRYYADLPETQVARVMGISVRAVSSHIARGMSSLQVVLEHTAGTSQPDGDAGPP